MTTATSELEWLLTTSQAARRLNVSSQRVVQLCVSGRLDFVETPLGRLLRPDSVEQMAREREAQRAKRSGVIDG